MSRWMNRIAPPLAILLSLSMLSACAATGAQKPDAVPFRLALTESVSDTGDGATASLEDDELGRIAAAFQTAIAEGEAEIARLEGEIAKLEQDNERKRAEVDSLVRQIEDRRAQVKRDYESQLLLAGVLGVFTLGLGSVVVGAGAVASLAAALSSDSRLRQLESDLSRARSEQSAIAVQVSSYYGRRSVALQQLAELRASKQRLVEALTSIDAGAPVPALEAMPEAVDAYRRVQLLEQILEHTHQEIATLTELRDAAQALSDALDGALEVLRGLAADAERLAEETRAAFLDILMAALSGDPYAVATDWLVAQLADVTRDVLNALDWPLADFVAHLVRTRFTGTDEEVASLTESLMNHLLGLVVEEATAWTFEETVDGPIPIPDLGTATTAVVVDEPGVVSGGSLTVAIEHSYVGDLRIAVRHGDVEQFLRLRAGGSEDEIIETYDLTELVGVEAAGDWTLVVSDEAAMDDGAIDAWELELHGATSL